MNGKLYFAGTETATEHMEYMERAIQSAKRMARSLIDIVTTPTNQARAKLPNHKYSTADVVM